MRQGLKIAGEVVAWRTVEFSAVAVFTCPALPCPLQIRMAPAEKPGASLGAGGLRALTWHLAEARGVPGNSGTLVR